MPFVTIRHITTYRYRRPVAFGEHRMMLHPRDSHDQRVIQADLKISPEPRSLRFVQDAFGNHVGIARFSRRSNELSFESVVCVEHSPRDGFVLEDAGRAFPVDYSVDELRDLAPYLERHQLDPIDAVGRWARELLFPSGATGAFELLTRLSRGIHHGFLYKRREAKGVQPPTETLRLGHGSCRDFAMLMIDARARLVSPRVLRRVISRSPWKIRRSRRAAQVADPLMPGRKYICRAPDGLISILQAAASATSTLSP